jgi:hypothetical protein
LFDNVRTEAGTLIYPKDPRHTANHAADYTANDRPYRASRSLTVSCTPLHSTRDTLGLACNWKKHGGSDSRRTNNIADHDNSIDFEMTTLRQREGIWLSQSAAMPPTIVMASASSPTIVMATTASVPSDLDDVTVSMADHRLLLGDRHC